MAINNNVPKHKSKELQKELYIIENKVRAQELENKKNHSAKESFK